MTACSSRRMTIVLPQVNHGNKPFGNLYVSDSTGAKFSRSLVGSVRSVPAGGGASKAEFDKVQGLDGIYISNVALDAERDLADWAHGHRSDLADEVGIPRTRDASRRTGA